MMNQDRTGFHPVYILAGLYIVAIYSFPLLFFRVNTKEYEGLLSYWPLALPLIMGGINMLIVIVYKEKIGRIRLLNCAVAIKYTLVPFYIIGGSAIAIALLLMFTPVIIMIFAGPMVATTFSVLGWTAMVGAAPFSIGYIYMSYKEGVHSKNLSVVAGILQFFFTLDVLSIMLLAFKDKRWIKATIVLMIILIISVIVISLWIILAISGMLI